jgi:hypothetical protein
MSAAASTREDDDDHETTTTQDEIASSSSTAASAAVVRTHPMHQRSDDDGGGESYSLGVQLRRGEPWIQEYLHRIMHREREKPKDDNTSSSAAAAAAAVIRTRPVRPYEYYGSSSVYAAFKEHDWTSEDFFVVMQLFTLCYAKMWRLKETYPGLSENERALADSIQRLREFMSEMNETNRHCSASKTRYSLQQLLHALSQADNDAKRVPGVGAIADNMSMLAPLSDHRHNTRLETNVLSFAAELQTAARVFELVRVIFDAYESAYSHHKQLYCMAVLKTLQTNLELKNRDFTTYQRLYDSIGALHEEHGHTDLIGVPNQVYTAVPFTNAAQRAAPPPIHVTVTRYNQDSGDPEDANIPNVVFEGASSQATQF